jgi:predicted RNA-binding protein YlxR (DUF448 family)
VGCRRKAPPEQLFRVVASPAGELEPGQGRPGRGAWLCPGSLGCLEAAARRRALPRALRRPLAAGAEARLAARVGWGAGREG